MININYYYSNFDFILILGLFGSTFLNFQIMIYNLIVAIKYTLSFYSFVINWEQLFGEAYIFLVFHVQFNYEVSCFDMCVCFIYMYILNKLNFLIACWSFLYSCWFFFFFFCCLLDFLFLEVAKLPDLQIRC